MVGTTAVRSRRVLALRVKDRGKDVTGDPKEGDPKGEI